MNEYDLSDAVTETVAAALYTNKMLYAIMMRVIKVGLIRAKEDVSNVVHRTFEGSKVSTCKVGLLLKQCNNYDHQISFPMSGTNLVHLGENQIWLVI